jgi:Protein of unknown function (DUF2752)
LPLRLGAPLLVGALAGCACAAILLADPTTPGGIIPVCPTKALLGLDCPGCGSMRMLYSLMHGNLLAAVKFNAMAVVGLVLLVVAYVTWTYGRIVGRQILSWQHHRWAAAVTLVLVSTWFVVRNLPFPPFTGLYV